MKRTKMKRRLAPAKEIAPMGGHILNPPEDCECPVIIKRERDDTRWVDATLCEKHCGPRFCSIAQTQLNEARRVYKEAHKRKPNEDK